MSWDQLELDGEFIEQQKAEQEAKAREIASMFHQCFSTDAGKFVLDRLKSVTLDRPVLSDTSTQFGAGIREGQNSIVRQIVEQMEIAKQQ